METSKRSVGGCTDSMRTVMLISALLAYVCRLPTKRWRSSNRRLRAHFQTCMRVSESHDHAASHTDTYSDSIMMSCSPHFSVCRVKFRSWQTPSPARTYSSWLRYEEPKSDEYCSQRTAKTCWNTWSNHRGMHLSPFFLMRVADSDRHSPTEHGSNYPYNPSSGHVTRRRNTAQDLANFGIPAYQL